MISKWLFSFTLKDKKIISPPGNNITSPATGKIIDVIDFSDQKEILLKKGVLGSIKTSLKDVMDDGYVIPIFMRVFDNHINRSPIDGKVISVKHSKGKFIPASTIRAIENEKTEIVIDSKIGKIKVIQIAGLIARRIETFIEPGNDIKKGATIGLIKLGSQVVLIVPKKVNIIVKKGQKVYAGKTVIGEIK